MHIEDFLKLFRLSLFSKGEKMWSGAKHGNRYACARDDTSERFQRNGFGLSEKRLRSSVRRPSRQQKGLQEVMQLFTLLAFLEPQLEPQKVAVLQRLAEELGIEAAVVNDLEQVCRGHVLKAFGDLYRRTFRDLNDDGVVQGYSRFILPMLGFGIDKIHQARYQALAGSAPGTLGAGLHAYYDHNGFPYPGSRQGLPYDYVAAHDVHHVIGGYATDPDGELQVLAFSMGLFPDHALLIAIPPLMQFQVGIADPLASSVAPKLTDQLRAPAFAAALERGANVVGPIRDLHWDFWEWIDRPLEEVRRDLNVR